jgi:hypothetical protein
MLLAGGLVPGREDTMNEATLNRIESALSRNAGVTEIVRASIRRAVDENDAKRAYEEAGNLVSLQAEASILRIALQCGTTEAMIQMIVAKGAATNDATRWGIRDAEAVLQAN